MTIKKTSIIGLGKLGLPMAACFASKGFKVIGIDKNIATIDSVKKGRAPFYEPDLQKLINKSGNNLEVSNDPRRAIEESDVSFLIVPTPSNKSGEFSNKYLENALGDLSLALKESQKKYHLFVISSTVMPSTIDKYFIPLIEKMSGRKLNEGFGICYNPEFIALGSVIRDFLNPDVLLIGETNKEDGQVLENFYKKIHKSHPYIARMSVVSAEITKISLNSYITTKISFANQLSQICSVIPGANIDAITQAIGSDRRVGTVYFKGGLSYGGPCFPRDNKAFSAFAKKHGHNAPLSQATDIVNNLQKQHLIDTVLKNHKNNGPVLLVGFAYKNNTPIIEESASLKLVDALLKNKINVVVHDPLAATNVKDFFGNKVELSSSLEKSLKKASTCVLISNSKETKVAIEKTSFLKPTTIIDCWRVIDPACLKGKVKYIPMGRAQQKL